MPAEIDFPRRLDVVLDVLYLIFNEGYESHHGNVPVRQELCEEALYLSRTITEHPAGNTPKTLALLALMYLQASRLNARMDTESNILLLAEQDRSLWDQEMIGSGLYYLGLSAEGEELSTYHLQASIAAKHAMAKDYQSTNWAGILEDYEGLMQISPTPIVMLNHAVALAMIKGNAAGLHALLQLKDQPVLRTYSLFYATCGELYERDGELLLAEENFRQALTLTENESARRFLEKKIQTIKNARQ
jgi:RNA polymerase sigma-70 factor (ECF subfamily)